eukprot:376032-Pelagomonas_calceolata.AAC.1
MHFIFGGLLGWGLLGVWRRRAEEGEFGRPGAWQTTPISSISGFWLKPNIENTRPGQQLEAVQQQHADLSELTSEEAASLQTTLLAVDGTCCTEHIQFKHWGWTTNVPSLAIKLYAHPLRGGGTFGSFEPMYPLNDVGNVFSVYVLSSYSLGCGRCTKEKCEKCVGCLVSLRAGGRSGLYGRHDGPGLGKAVASRRPQRQLKLYGMH